MRDDGTFNPFAPGEPPRDEALAAQLRRSVGDVPTGAVDWDALAARIARALPARPATWWSYTERWARRIVPLAVAAALVGAVTLWNASDASAVVVAQAAPADVVADVVQGVPVEDAARTFSRTMTAEDVLTAPESE